jgi:hypothetical protein
MHLHWNVYKLQIVIFFLSFQGACILNMLRDYLSADTFKRGIVQYLQKYSYKNTKNEDLWNSMMHVSGTQKLCIWGWLADCIVLFCPVLWYSIPMNQSTF